MVDDDFDHLESWYDILEAEGHEVAKAHSGEEALDLWALNSYDLTFMDVKLPGINGIETSTKIHEMEKNAKVVFMTGFQKETLAELDKNNDANQVFHKPMVISEVMNFVQSCDYGNVILIADDDVDFNMSISQILTESGYRVRRAFNGIEALVQAKTNAVDAILLDLKMEPSDGFQVYEELKQAGQNKPIVIITGFAHEEKGALQELSEAPDIAAVMKKPLDLGELIRLMGELTQ